MIAPEFASRPAFERLLLDLRRVEGDLEMMLGRPEVLHREEVERLAHVVTDWGLRAQEWLAEGERGGQ
jgi:hypothetical protein